MLALLVEVVVETGKQAITGGIKWPAIVAMAGGIGVCLATQVGM